MKYALGTDASMAPAESTYTTTIPTATNAGIFYVWYKTAGDGNHADTTAACVKVTVGAKSIAGATVTLDKAQRVYIGSKQGVTVETVTLADNTVLTKNDYAVGGTTDAADVGAYTLMVTGKGNYEGTASARWTIVESPKTPVPVQDDSTEELHLVKGEKFTLPGTGWISSDKKKVSITKKGVLTAKKVTEVSRTYRYAHSPR